MTFNVRYANADDGADAWQRRKERVFDVIRRHAPDLVGRQEALPDTARRESARVTLARRARRAELPLVLTGDLNAGKESPPLVTLRAAGLRDTYRDAHPDAAPAGTFNGFRGDYDDDKIDYVLVDGGWSTRSARIVRDRDGGRYPVGPLRCGRGARATLRRLGPLPLEQPEQRGPQPGVELPAGSAPVHGLIASAWVSHITASP